MAKASKVAKQSNVAANPPKESRWKKFGKKLGGYAKTKAKEAKKEAKDMMDIRPTIKDSSGRMRKTVLLSGEFVLDRYSRLWFATMAKILVLLLFVSAIANLLFGIATYFILGGYSTLLAGKYTVGTVPNYMFANCVLLIALSLFWFWRIEMYQIAEDDEKDERDVAIESSVPQLKCVIFTALVFSAYLTYCTHEFKWNFYKLSTEMPEIIKSAMKSYNISIEQKKEIDRIQWMGSCCGSDSYSSWRAVNLFNTPTELAWYSKKFGVKYNARPDKWFDVPFSCCKTRITAPCRFYNVDNDGSFYKNFIAAEQTINTNGCSDVINKYLSKFRVWIKYFQLIELLCCYLFLLLMKMICSSITSQYHDNCKPPVTRFPILCSIIMIIVLVLFYFYF